MASEERRECGESKWTTRRTKQVRWSLSKDVEEPEVSELHTCLVEWRNFTSFSLFSNTAFLSFSHVLTLRLHCDIPPEFCRPRTFFSMHSHTQMWPPSRPLRLPPPPTASTVAFVLSTAAAVASAAIERAKGKRKCVTKTRLCAGRTFPPISS